MLKKKKDSTETWKEKSKQTFRKVKRQLTEFRYNPGAKLRSLARIIKKFVKEEKLFCLFLLLNTLNGLLLRAFTIGTIENVLSIAPILADFSFLLFIASFGYLMREKKRIYYWFILTIVFSIICTINSSYFTFYSSFCSISFIFTVKYLAAVGDAAVQNVFQFHDFLYLFMPCIYYFVYHRMRKNHYFSVAKDTKTFKHSFVVSIVTAILFCCTLTGTDIGRLTKQWARDYVVQKYGIYIYHVNDLFRSVEPKIISLFGYDSAIKTFNEYFSETKEPETNEYTNRFEGKNVIMIHAESMQNFLINLEFNGVEVTPNLNKLVKESLYFDNFYSQVSVGTSSDTEFTLATSLMPANIGTAFVNYYDHKFIAIPQMLKDKGYYTFSMHGNVADYWNRRIMHQNLGYEKFYAKDSFNIDEVIGLGLSDVSFFRQSVQKLKAIQEEHEKFYGTFIMLTNHTPFYDVDDYGPGPFDVSMKESVYNEETKTYEDVVYPYMEETKLGRYLKSAHYADYALGVFFEELEANGLLDNTIIVLYGDHDARLPRSDYNLMYNYDKVNNTVLDENDPNYHEFTKLDEELNRKVPLIIWSKDNTENAETIHNVMGMYDLGPTLGNMLGFYNPYALGHDIFSILDEDNVVVFPTGNFLTNKVYYDNQEDSFVGLNNATITNEYIDYYKKYSDDLLSVSNAILVFDLIRNVDENGQSDAQIIQNIDAGT